MNLFLHILTYAAVLGIVAFATIDHALRTTAPQNVIPTTLTVAGAAGLLGAVVWLIIRRRSNTTKLVVNALTLLGAGTFIARRLAEAIATVACWGVGILVLLALAARR